MQPAREKIHRLKPISVNHNASNIQNDDGRGGGRMVIVFAIYSDNPSLNLTEVHRFFPKSCKKRRKICKKEAEVSQFKNIYLLSIVEKAKWKKAGRSEQFYYNLRHLQVTNYLGYLTIFKDMQITKLISVFEGNNTIPW